MTQTEKFIARLHFIAAGSDPLDCQIDAVADLFARSLEEARQSLGDDRERMRRLADWLAVRADQENTDATR